MGAVTSFVHPTGVRCWFWSKDHRPPHFHAERPGHWEIVVRILPQGRGDWRTKVEYGSPSAKEVRELVRLADAHAPALLREWEEKVNPDG